MAILHYIWLFFLSRSVNNQSINNMIFMNLSLNNSELICQKKEIDLKCSRYNSILIKIL